MKRTWFEIARMAIGLSKAIHEKTQVVCPNPSCPLHLNTTNKTIDVPLTQDELVRKHKAQYKKNHPNG